MYQKRDRHHVWLGAGAFVVENQLIAAALVVKEMFPSSISQHWLPGIYQVPVKAKFSPSGILMFFHPKRPCMEGTFYAGL